MRHNSKDDSAELLRWRRSAGVVTHGSARHRVAEPEGVLTALMLALLVIGVAVVVVVAQMLQLPPTRRSGTWRAGPTPALRAESVVAQPEAMSAPAEELIAAPPAGQAPTTPRLAVGARARVANTDGLGVVLHTAPRAGARRPAGLLEGTSVTVQEFAGTEWVRVHSATRQDGWVPITFLAPGD